MSKTAAGETEVPPAFLLQLQKLISLIKTKNPNPLPIGIKFGFLQCGINMNGGFNKIYVCWQRSTYSTIPKRF